MTLQSEDLLGKAEKYLSYGVPSITIKDDKKPTLDTWTDIRDLHKLPSEELLIQWLTNPLATHLAIVSGGRFLIVDYDGLGEQRLRNRILPRCSTSIQDKFERTTRTKTPHGGHTLIARDPENSDTKVEEIEAWKLTSDELEHQEVLLLSSEKYVIERGPGYEPVRDIEALEQFTKEEEIEFCEKLREVKAETKVIRIIIKKLAPYYEKSNRDKLVFSFSGYAHKYGVTETIIHDTIEDLMDLVRGDEECESRFNVIKETCKKTREEVSGREELLDAVDGDDSIILAIQQQYKKLGYFKFANGSGEDHGNKRQQQQKETTSADDSDDSDDKVQDVEVLRESIIELFKDQFERSYATVEINGHYEPFLVHPNSSKFKMWASVIYNRKVGKPLLSDHFIQACNILQGEASLFGNNEKKLELRISSGPEIKERTLYYDLANKTRQVIKITENGWSIQESPNAPITFRRYSQTKAQVTPERNYAPDIFDQFMRLINVKITDKDGNEIVDKTNNLRLLMKCYIISLFIPDIPQAILMLHGPQGTAKTSSSETIKELVDPSPIPTLALPRDMLQLIQQLSHNRVVFYDNVSYVTDEQSDQLCRAATGSGSSKRMLFSDDEDILYWYIRSVGISSINVVATRPDLLDRAILAPSSTINEKDFESMEEYVKAERKRIIPQLLGYIFDILVKAIKVKNQGGIRNYKKSRLVDFCEYGEIISRCMGYPEGEFGKAYTENLDRITNAAIDSGIVVQIIMRFMEDKEEWDSVPSELYHKLEETADKLCLDIRVIKEWPKAANVLSRRIDEYKSSLAKVNIQIDKYELPATGQTSIRIRKIKPEVRSISSESSEPLNKNTGQSSNDSYDSYDTVPTSSEMRFYGGYWHCENCKEKGDKFYMENHRCNSKKEKKN